MKYIKKIGISIFLVITLITILTFFVSTFNYFYVINDKLTEIFKIFIPISSMFIGGFYIGRKSKKKGYIEGLKLGTLISILLIIFNVIIGNSFKIKYLLFYFIVVASSMLGSMIGIKKND